MKPPVVCNAGAAWKYAPIMTAVRLPVWQRQCLLLGFWRRLAGSSTKKRRPDTKGIFIRAAASRWPVIRFVRPALRSSGYWFAPMRLSGRSSLAVTNRLSFLLSDGKPSQKRKVFGETIKPKAEGFWRNTKAKNRSLFSKTIKQEITKP